MNFLANTALAALAIGVAAVPALAAQGDAQGGRKLMATLTGAAEVPGPGDADGRGSFTGRINAGQTQVCYTLTAAMIDTATAAHIHRGAAGVAGPVVAPLAAPAGGSSEACATVTRALARDMMRSPRNYYVNVHNAAFPAGAVRGQLMK